MLREYHLHLSGSTPPPTLYEIHKKSGFKQPGIANYNDFRSSMDMTKSGSLDEYLSIVHMLDRGQSSPYAVEKCMYTSLVDLYVNGVGYAEIRWNPAKRNLGGVIDLDILLISARAGMERARSIFGIEGQMILCMGRDCSEAANEAILKKAIAYLGKGVIGVDVAGSEKIPLSDHTLGLLTEAAKHGLMTTIHCGEEWKEDTESELQRIVEMSPKRIGHGIQFSKYPRLLSKLSNKGIVLEVCISSNLATGVVKGYEEFYQIFKTLEDAGVKYELCTDSTYPLSTTLQREHGMHRFINGI